MPRQKVMSFGAAIDYRPPNPERTARRPAANGWDVVFQEWTNRAAMARSIRIQERSGTRNRWRAVVPLGVTEGY